MTPAPALPLSPPREAPPEERAEEIRIRMEALVERLRGKTPERAAN